MIQVHKFRNFWKSKVGALIQNNKYDPHGIYPSILIVALLTCLANRTILQVADSSTPFWFIWKILLNNDKRSSSNFSSKPINLSELINFDSIWNVPAYEKIKSARQLFLELFDWLKLSILNPSIMLEIL